MKFSFLALASTLVCAAMPCTASAADINVLSVAAVKEVLEELIPAFENGSSHKVHVTWTGSADIKKRVLNGEVFDVVVSSAQDVDDFIKQGKVLSGTRTDLMKVGIGVAVPPRRAKVDLSSGESLKKALLEAKAIGYSTGASGTYIETLFQRLGIFDQVKGKLKQTASGVAVGSIVATGEVDIGFQQISELIHYRGLQYVGPLPAELQNTTVYAAAIHAGAKQAEVGKALISAFTSPPALPLIKDLGMEPPDLKL